MYCVHGWECSTSSRTYSSRIQLPTETPPQLMPPTRLPASDSRRLFRALPSLLGFFIDMGLAPAKESCRLLPMALSYPAPLIMAAEVLESLMLYLSEARLTVVPCDEGDEEAFRVGVAMSMGGVAFIIDRSEMEVCEEAERAAVLELEAVEEDGEAADASRRSSSSSSGSSEADRHPPALPPKGALSDRNQWLRGIWGVGLSGRGVGRGVAAPVDAPKADGR